MAGNTLSIGITSNTKGLQRGLASAKGQLRGFDQSTKKSSIGLKTLAKGFLAFTVIKKLSGSFREAAASVKLQSTLMAQTRAVLKSTGGAAGVTAKNIDKLSTSLEKKSLIDAEQIQNGANLLLTFTNIKNSVGKNNDIFNQATTLAVDLSTALGQDMKSSSIQLGKALNDPTKGITALSRVGVSFTAGQKKQIKAMQESGNLMGAQKVILKELNKEFGGSAKAAGDTFAGKVKHLKDIWDGLLETLIRKAIPTLSTIVDWLAVNLPVAVAKFKSALDKVKTVIKSVTNFVKSNQTTLKVVAVIITTILIPALISWGVQSVIAKVKVVGAWVAAQAAAIKSSAQQVLAHTRTTLAWIASGARATGTAALYGIAFAFMAAEAIKNAAIQVAQQAKAAASWALSTAAMAAQKIALVAFSAAAKAAAVAQILLNVAMNLNPISIIIIALIALGAAFVILWKKSSTFRAIVIGTWNAIKSAGIKIFNVLKSAVGVIFKGISIYVKTYIAIIKAVLKGIKATITAVIGFFKSMASGIKSKLSSIASAVKSGVNKVKSFFSSAWSAIRSATSSAFGKIKTAVSDGISRVISLVKGLPGKVKSAVGNLGSILYSAGQKIIQGLINGISSMFGAVQGKLGDLTSKLTSWKGPESLDKVLLFNAGALLIGGLVNGLESKESAVKRTLNNLTKTIAATPLSLGDVEGGNVSGRASFVQPANSGNTTINLTVNAPVGSDPITIGRELDKHLKAFYSTTGVRR